MMRILSAAHKAAPVAAFAVLAATAASAHDGPRKPDPLSIAEQGSFAAGGTVVTNPGTFDPLRPTPAGQTLHGDHAYVFYQIPEKARKLPMVMWHGSGQFRKTYETTPDGREGYQTIFLRRGFATYLLDQPRRGDAGRATIPGTYSATPDEQGWFGTFRLGIWPNFFPGVQFSRQPEALNQYWRQITPSTAPESTDVDASAVAAIFERIGRGILITHSASGGRGWRAALNSSNVRAIAAYEPGSGFIFPEGEVPPPIPSPYNGGTSLSASAVPLSEFMKLTKIPIIIIYGDFIPSGPTPEPADQWRIRIEMARLWRDAVNRHGGDVTVVALPEVGIRGNTHFPFSDLNNIQVADHLSKWLKKKHLDDYANGRH